MNRIAAVLLALGLVVCLVLGVIVFKKKAADTEEPAPAIVAEERGEQEAPESPAEPIESAPDDIAPPERAAAEETAGDETVSEGAAAIGFYGLVTEAGTKYPIPEARVFLVSWADTAVEAYSDDDGAFSFEAGVGSVHERTTVNCVAPGYALAQKTASAWGDPVPGDQVLVDFVLTPGATVSGRVTDAATHQAVAGARIQVVDALLGLIERAQGRNKWEVLDIRTDDEGAYAIASLEPGSFRISVNPTELGYVFRPGEAVTLNIKEGGLHENVDFALHRGATVQGTVRTQAGVAAPGTNMSLMPGNLLETAMGNIEAMQVMGQLGAEADEQGRFEIVGLDFGTSYRLNAKRADSAQTVTDAFSVAQGDSPLRIDITLLPGCTVSGTARYENGTPAANYALMLFPDIGAMLTGAMAAPATTTTTETGAFEFKALGVGRFTLTNAIDPENFNPFENDAINPFGNKDDAVVVETDGINNITGLEYTVARKTSDLEDESGTGVIVGLVLDADGAPAAQVPVAGARSDDAKAKRTVTTGEDGSFTLAKLGGSRYDLSVESTKGDAEMAGVATGSNVTLRLVARASIGGKVVDAEGLAVAGCKVQLKDQDADLGKLDLAAFAQRLIGGDKGGEITDEDGLFKFEGVRPGDYVINAMSMTKGSAESDVVQVDAGEERTDLRIKLEPGVLFAGTIADSQGQSVQGATVALTVMGTGDTMDQISRFLPEQMREKAGSATSDGDGRFEIGNVAPGVYRLSASHGSYAPTAHEGLVIAPGRDVTDYHVALLEGGSATGEILVDGAPKEGIMVIISGPSGTHMATTDSDGRFNIERIPPGSSIIQAVDIARMTAGDLAGATMGQQVIDVTDGESLDIDLGPPANGVPVTGTIAGPLGSMTTITLYREGAPHSEDVNPLDMEAQIEMLRYLGASTIAGEGGTFEMEAVEPGTYVLEILTIDMDLANPNPLAMLEMDRTPQIRQTIVIEEGVPLTLDQLELPEFPE